jgi:hypothetical protein
MSKHLPQSGEATSAKVGAPPPKWGKHYCKCPSISPKVGKTLLQKLKQLPQNGETTSTKGQIREIKRKRAIFVSG